MTIFMSEIICISNRMLCKGDFLNQIEKIAKAKPKSIVLREKDLSEEEYFHLAKQVLKIYEKYDVHCILHSFVNVAKKLECPAIHLPLPILRTLTEKDKAFFTVWGASCHSVEDALEAQRLGCTYITAGHVFETDCKKGLEGRGLEFLHNVCESVTIPVYAIGGINIENISAVKNAGASGACIMSSIMTCENPGQYLLELDT